MSKMSQKPAGHQSLIAEKFAFVLILIVMEAGILAVYATCFDYSTDSPQSIRFYQYFPDVSVMIFFGFGFLMTFFETICIFCHRLHTTDIQFGCPVVNSS